MPGETEQQKGRQGALAAKLWLDRTTRINANLINPDNTAKKKLTLKKAHYVSANDVFSFDLGGHFREGDFEGQDFLAECKNYANSSDLGTHYKLFLAHCYRAIATEHHMADQFFWISFSPHSATTWDKITTADAVQNAVLDSSTRDINFTPDQNLDESYQHQISEMVSERLWLLILSDKQVKHLVLTKEHHGVIEEHIVKNAREVTL